MLDVFNPLVVGMPLAPLSTERSVKESLTACLLANLGLDPARCLLVPLAEDTESSSATDLQRQAATR